MQRKTKPTSGGGDTLDEIREALVDPSELMETQVSGDGSHVSSKEGRNSSLAGDFVDVDASETGIVAWLLFSAELKPRGYYLEHVFYLDHVIFTNMSHVYYLDQ